MINLEKYFQLKCVIIWYRVRLLLFICPFIILAGQAAQKASTNKPRQYLIDCSTIDVKTSILVQKEAQAKNLFTLDAPVSGGVIGANEGTLTFMTGGDIKTYNKVKFLFDILR